MEIMELCKKEIPKVSGKGFVNRILRYSICKSLENEGYVYGIKIEEEIDGNVNSDIVPDISKDRDVVENLLNFLVKNGVDNVCFKDVIKDLNFN